MNEEWEKYTNVIVNTADDFMLFSEEKVFL